MNVKAQGGTSLIPTINQERLLEHVRGDRELAYKLRGLSAIVRLGIGPQLIDIVVSNGVVSTVRAAEGAADLTITAPDEYWKIALSEPSPPAGYETLTMGLTRGVRLEGDFASLTAAYQGAWQRLYLILRASVCGVTPRRAHANPFRATDNAVGRYRYVPANGVEARVYYEEAGSGSIPLLLQHTAGADGRQYRHLLANPRMQERFRMIAYDLPYHGKSLPPEGERWWEQFYRPTRESLMSWVVAIADSLELQQPWFMGCSVGGQLALDLAASHANRFGAFIALNGWYANPVVGKAIDNDVFRTPSVSEDYPMSIILGGTSPHAPEAAAQEVYWIYRSNYPGIYAGDNDYFMHEHDLRENGHRIDAKAKPVFLVSGEYDASAHDPVHGAPAVAAHVPGAVYIEAKGLGHFAPSDDPISFGEMIMPVLDEVARRVGRDISPRRAT